MSLTAQMIADFTASIAKHQAEIDEKLHAISLLQASYDALKAKLNLPMAPVAVRHPEGYPGMYHALPQGWRY
jgi:hypothetical protein